MRPDIVILHMPAYGRSGDYVEGRGYGDLKSEVADVVLETLTPLRERTRELLEDRTELERILAEGAERARGVAEATLRDVYDRVGFLPAAR